MTTTGTVREWHDDEGWGVIDAAETPGGCWVHFSAVVMPGYRSLEPGRAVTFAYEAGRLDGFAFRATRVDTGPGDTSEPAQRRIEVDGEQARAAYTSRLRLEVDES